MTARPGRLAPVSAAARIDANGTVWRLRSLVAMGHDSTRIAGALDVSPGLVRRVVRGQPRTITAEFHTAACQLWDAWWDKTPLTRTPAQRAAAARALRQAARHDWPAAAGLDEDPARRARLPALVPLPARDRDRHRAGLPPGAVPPPAH
jgi:hypothetical protein